MLIFVAVLVRVGVFVTVALRVGVAGLGVKVSVAGKGVGEGILVSGMGVRVGLPGWRVVVGVVDGLKAIGGTTVIFFESSTSGVNKSLGFQAGGVKISGRIASTVQAGT